MKKLIAGAVLALSAIAPAHAQTEPFLGQLAWVPYNFAPRGWHFCDGTVLLKSQNEALFLLLGTTYGGDGVTTFALPDLRGRAMISEGEGPGLTPRALAEQGGVEAVTLTEAEMPAHSHQLYGSKARGNREGPQSNLLARSAQRNVDGGIEESKQLPYRAGGVANAPMSDLSIGTTGGDQPHENMAPFLALNCIIAMEGVFPPQP